nr:hypothetical protein [Thioalkalivibrio versutus]
MGERGSTLAVAILVGAVMVVSPATGEEKPVVEGEETTEAREAPTFDQSKVFRLLGDAAEHFDEIASLPESHWLRRDQERANRDIDDLIEDALEVMDVPEIVGMREDFRALEGRIASEQNDIAELRERRMFAPDTDASTLSRFTPTDTLRSMTASTRGDFDRLIEAREANIEAYEEELEGLKRGMSESLGSIGLEMPPDQLELWLSSAIGDDVVSMGVVFQSIRTITLRLEELTRESGENLGVASRYYGMVVMLHRLVVSMQAGFVEKVDDEILPHLQAYRDEADDIIAESRELIRNGGNRVGLESNIAANELTKRAIDLYLKIVKSQREKVADALEISEREHQVAINTYRTVRLSSNVADLIRDGLGTFEALSDLQVPETAEFQNEEIRQEFRLLTERLNG